MSAQPAADNNHADNNHTDSMGTPAIPHRLGLLTAAFACVALLLIAAYLSPQLTAAMRSSEFSTFEFLLWLSKVLFVWFVFALFAAPASWLLLRSAIRRRLGQELDDPLPAQSQAEWVSGEVEEVVRRVEEMASAYSKSVAHDNAKRSSSVETEEHETGHDVVPLVRR